MITLGNLVMILDLHRQGLSVSAIARQVSVDRKTARSNIAKGLEPPAYKKRPPRPCRIVGGPCADQVLRFVSHLKSKALAEQIIPLGRRPATDEAEALRNHSIASKPAIMCRAVAKLRRPPTFGVIGLARKWSLSMTCCKCLETRWKTLVGTSPLSALSLIAAG